MNSYLSFARDVLLVVKQPLSAVEILKQAYRLEMVPDHLYGKTQHKTLQARLAEDIRTHSLTSDFVRTAPGRFFLRELFSDVGVPEKFKTEYKARRRLFELENFQCLFAEFPSVKKNDTKYQSNKYRYFYENMSFRKSSFNVVPVSLFIVAKRGNCVLSHRPISRMQDPIRAKRFMGFSTYLTSDDLDLFDNDDLGIESAIKRVFIEDMNALELINNPNSIKIKFQEIQSKIISRRDEYNLLLMIVLVSFSDYFDPVDRAPQFREMRWTKIENTQNYSEKM